jgi:hypothetical protein
MPRLVRQHTITVIGNVLKLEGMNDRKDRIVLKKSPDMRVVAYPGRHRSMVAERRLANDPVKTLAFLAPWRDELAGVVVESTYYRC